MVKTQIIFITNDQVELEAEIFESTTNNRRFILLCHPDPRMGGNYHNNVISGIFEMLVHQNISCLRFNFRGVGRSTGLSSIGLGELEDVKTCIDFLIEKKKATSIFIIGYSFGALIGCAAINYNDKLVGYAAISLPFDHYVRDYEVLSKTNKPKLFIQGDNDNFIPLSKFIKHYAAYQDPKKSIIVRRANHFYWGFEDKIAGEIIDFFKSLK